MTKAPALFISHGAPNMLLHGGATYDFLTGLGERFERPKAVMVVSAHWETEEPMLTTHPKPDLIYDFYGFEPEMYKATYPAKGAGDFANAARNAMPLASVDPDRGLDHGAWSPLKMIYPDASIPVFQLSVQPRQNARHHYETGRKIAALREEGVMILASGNTTHNLRAAFGKDQSGLQKSLDFAMWLKNVLESGDHIRILDWERSAPDAQWNHPTPEHFLPIFTALGSAGSAARGERLFEGIDLGVLAMDAYSFD